MREMDSELSLHRLKRTHESILKQAATDEVIHKVLYEDMPMLIAEVERLRELNRQLVYWRNTHICEPTKSFVHISRSQKTREEGY